MTPDQIALAEWLAAYFDRNGWPRERIPLVSRDGKARCHSRGGITIRSGNMQGMLPDLTSDAVGGVVLGLVAKTTGAIDQDDWYIGPDPEGWSSCLPCLWDLEDPYAMVVDGATLAEAATAALKALEEEA